MGFTTFLIVSEAGSVMKIQEGISLRHVSANIPLLTKYHLMFKTGLMPGDWKSLRDNIYQFSGLPPTSIWSEQNTELHNDGILYQNKLLKIIEDSEPLFLKKQISM
jgi:hypothetical protein